MMAGVPLARMAGRGFRHGLPPSCKLLQCTQIHVAFSVSSQPLSHYQTSATHTKTPCVQHLQLQSKTINHIITLLRHTQTHINMHNGMYQMTRKSAQLGSAKTKATCLEGEEKTDKNF